MDPHIVAAFVAKQSTDPDPASELGEKTSTGLGATNFIVGSIVEERGVLRMQASLYARGRGTSPLGRATASGVPDSAFDMADRLAADLLAARVGGVSVDALGTSSMVALRAYVEGERQLFAARYAGAADAFSRAVAADSQFARAYLRLSYSASLGGHDSLSRASAARAGVLKGRLSPNDRVLLVAWTDLLHINIPMSIFMYEKVLTQDERNPEAWLQLAEIRYHWGPTLGISIASAADAFRHVVAVVPGDGAALIHLARLEARDAPGGGGFDTLAAAARRLNLGATESLELRTLGAILSGRRSERDSILAEAAARGALTERHLLSFALQFSDTVMSVALARELIRPDAEPAIRITGYVDLAQIEASHGRVRAALKLADNLASIAPERAVELRVWILSLPFAHASRAERLAARDALSRTQEVMPSVGPSAGQIAGSMIYPPRRRYLEAVLSLLAGDTARTLALSRELAAWPRPNVQDSAFAADYARAIHAEMLIGASPAAAAEAFTPAHTAPDRVYPGLMSFVDARARLLRAESLASAGHTAEALSWLETFPDPAGYDMWFLGPALLRRAQLYASVGRTADARRSYDRFLALWAGADAELAQTVKDATRARGGLAR